MLLTPPTLARYTVGLLIAVAVAFLMWYFRSIVVYILVSALLAIIFKPLVGRLARLRIRGWHLPRWAAALATLILIWVLFVVACTLFVPLVFDKLYQFATLDFGSVAPFRRGADRPYAGVSPRSVRPARRTFFADRFADPVVQEHLRLRYDQYGLFVDRQSDALGRDRLLFDLVHHLFLPQRRRVVPVDAQSTLSGACTRQYRAGDVLRLAVADALLYGNPERKLHPDDRDFCHDDLLRYADAGRLLHRAHHGRDERRALRRPGSSAA